jgi:hypothetical protein
MTVLIGDDALSKFKWIEGKTTAWMKKIEMLKNIKWDRVETRGDALTIFDLLCDVYHGCSFYMSLYNSMLDETRTSLYNGEVEAVKDKVRKLFASVDGPALVMATESVRDKIKERLAEPPERKDA